MDVLHCCRIPFNQPVQPSADIFASVRATWIVFAIIDAHAWGILPNRGHHFAMLHRCSKLNLRLLLPRRTQSVICLCKCRDHFDRINQWMKFNSYKIVYSLLVQGGDRSDGLVHIDAIDFFQRYERTFQRLLFVLQHSNIWFEFILEKRKVS